MKQLVQLQASLDAYQAAGLEIVAMTYDSPELQQAFVSKHNISIPLLSDEGGASARALGIFNEEYAPDDYAYGVAHPGVFVVSPAGEIKAKVFVEAYSERVNASAVLAVAQQALGI